MAKRRVVTAVECPVNVCRGNSMEKDEDNGPMPVMVSLSQCFLNGIDSLRAVELLGET